jgi:SAM-dependent methyltransferase
MGNDALVQTVKRGDGQVIYTTIEDLWENYEDLLIRLAREIDAKDIAELGGGANPLVGNSERWGFANHRTVVDISATELEKAETTVETRVADLCQPITDDLAAYDFVFSQMLCEHLPAPEAFHRNCFNLLRPGGLAVHFFPTLYTLPYVINKVIPEETARSILRKAQPGRLDDPKREKFPAFYRWTTGPTPKARQRFESIGFTVSGWQACFGHRYYEVLPPLHALELAKSKYLLKHPVPALTSFGVVILRKPS